MKRNLIASTVVQAVAIVCLGTACNGGGGETAGVKDSEKESGGSRSAKAVTLKIPRQPNEGEMIHIQVPVGKLDKGTQIDVLTSKGELVGTVSPFGIQAADIGGVYSIAIPASEVVDARIELFLEIEEKEGGAKRAPTNAEVGELEVVYLPVSKKPEKE